jgi:hypothetical protein
LKISRADAVEIVRANLEASRAVRPAPSDDASRQSSAG